MKTSHGFYHIAITKENEAWSYFPPPLNNSALIQNNVEMEEQFTICFFTKYKNTKEAVIYEKGTVIVKEGRTWEVKENVFFKMDD